jgi:hypothetical protein
MVVGKRQQKTENMKKKDLMQTLFPNAHNHLLLNNTVECINAYTMAVSSIINDATQNETTAIDADIMFLEKLQTTNQTLADKVKLYLNIALCILENTAENAQYKNYLELRKTRKEPFKTPVVIVAGGASLMDKIKAETYRDYLRKKMQGFTGTIISGGTTAGIPGLVGEVKEELEKQRTLYFDLVGYLPGMLPTSAAKSKAYDIFCETDSDHFSVLEILSYWCDLVCNGIHPSDVLLVGIDGGDIAAMEYRIALSLGAKVHILANSGRAASELMEDKFWETHCNLLEILPG